MFLHALLFTILFPVTASEECLSLFLFPTHSVFHLAPVSGHGALAEATPPLWARAMWAPLTLKPSLTPSAPVLPPAAHCAAAAA